MAQFFRFAFGVVFALLLLVGALASGALEKPDGSRLRPVDIYYWAFGYPADDPRFLRGQPPPVVTADATATPPPVAAPPPKPPTPKAPDDQVRFQGIVKRFATSFDAAANPQAQRKLRGERATAICDAMKSLSVEKWVGTVKSVGHDAAGNVVLVIGIDGLLIGDTGAAADNARSVIPHDSVLSGWADVLKPDSNVVFTGGFFTDRQDCLKQANATTKQAVTMPQYTMKFVNLATF